MIHRKQFRNAFVTYEIIRLKGLCIFNFKMFLLYNLISFYVVFCVCDKVIWLLLFSDIPKKWLPQFIADSNNSEELLKNLKNRLRTSGIETYEG